MVTLQAVGSNKWTLSSKRSKRTYLGRSKEFRLTEPVMNRYGVSGVAELCDIICSLNAE